MSSIQRLEQADSKLEPVWSGGYPPQQYHKLTIDFRVFYRGLNHVAGVVASTDGWRSREEITAKWVGFTGAGDEIELWQVEKGFPTGISRVEYVIFCEDYRAVDDMKKLYKTDNGQPFIVTKT